MTVKIKLNHNTVGQLLRSHEMQAILNQKGHQIAAAAGPGHRVEEGPTPKRARTAVITDTWHARKAEATSRNLTRAIDAGRG